MSEKATDEPVERQEICTPERYCDNLAFVLINSPQNMPWVLNPCSMEHEGEIVKVVTLAPSKGLGWDNKKFMVSYCPFCQADISPHKKVEKKRVWTPFGRKS